MHHSAAQWIVGLLSDKNIPFQICGGLAARAYGSHRELNDIDLFVPGEFFPVVVEAGRDFVSKPAAQRQEEGWDLTYVQFQYEGVKVEVGNADDVSIYDSVNHVWIPMNIDFSRYVTAHLLGLDLPVMLKDDLIHYKLILSRPVDIEDIRAISNRD